MINELLLEEEEEFKQATSLDLKGIQAIVAEAWQGSRVLRIEDYTSKDGTISTMRIRLLGPDGYLEVLKASLDMLHAGEVDMSTGETPESSVQAATALAASWAKSINKLHTQRNYKEELDTQSLEHMGHALNEKKELILKNVSIIAREYKYEAPRKVSNNALVRAKNLVVKLTPMGQFRGQLNLTPDNISGISVMT